MKTAYTALAGLVGAIAVGALGGVGRTAAPATTVTTASAVGGVTSSLNAHPGKILAGNCFQCHGTLGRGGAFGSLAGEPAAEIYEEMKEFQAGSDEPDETIMVVHARAYTDTQLRLIADFFSKVTP